MKPINRFARAGLLAFALLACSHMAQAQPASALGSDPHIAHYDPLAIDPAQAVQTLDLGVYDSVRQRDIPIRIYLPAARTAQPVVLFSHGLGGSRETNVYQGQHWAARGYVGVFMQHPGSDDAVWKDVPKWRRLRALKQAANADNLVLRAQDVPAVLDQLARWTTQAGHPLSGRLDMAHIGMSGHSFGAVTTQAVSGQQFDKGAGFTDARIKAALVMSPSSRADASRAFGGVRIPWLLMTGTLDEAPVGHISAKDRLAVFPALPAGSKYELVLDGAEHSAFTDTALRGDKAPRNANHHRVILALSTAFWDAYLRNDAAAKAWLDGAGPASVLEPADHWQRK